MKYDIIIVGAGPAGLFAAYEIANNSDLKVLVIDKGKDVDKRVCPSISQYKRCLKCKPCNILCGLGGAGGLSDGKLNLKSNIGGDLEEFVSKQEADGLIEKIDRIFLSHGSSKKLYGKNSHDLEKKAAEAGIEFIPIHQRHIGSDMLPSVIKSIKTYLEKKDVEFLLETKVKKIDKKNGSFDIELDNDKKISCKYVIGATGRSGSDWLISEAKRLGIKTQFAPIDIGVRVEVPAVVMESIVEYAWDPKFHIYTKRFDDFVRTFCTCPNGFVVMEDYGEYIGVNGHSNFTTKSENTNFAFLVNIKLTKPLENTTAYGKSIAKLTTTIGGKMPIIQRLEDLKKGRRSTVARIKKSFINPTLDNATPGDISMALPHRIVTDIIEGLEKLDEVIPGVASAQTLLYAPEIKFYSMRFIVDTNLETNIKNLFVAGDGAGLSRGIVASAATGIIAAKGIINKK